MSTAISADPAAPAATAPESANPAGAPPTADAAPPAIGLDDKYLATGGRIYLSGIQALVRLTLVQRLRDQAAGLNTAGFVSGYRGSPLGPLDEHLWKAKPLLEARHVRFVPGVNEDLAMTAVWGSQQVELLGPSKYDGVYAMWYGKGPGVDRCGDVMKHANHFGSSRHGGVLLVAGDDHGAYSSTLPHQSDHIFAASMVPVLYPSNVQEILDLGLHGWAMSRYSGCFVGLKCIADTVESSASVDAAIDRVRIAYPDDFTMPEGGLNARLTDAMVGAVARQYEARMQDYKIYAALAYARANQLNHTTLDSADYGVPARLGIVASGKAYQDVLEALDELGLTEREAARIGLRLFKVAMPWPLEPDSIRAFATGLEEILVVEEKRQVVEYQLKEQLYNWREDVRPRVIGKFDEQGEWVHPRGEWLLPPKADFTIAQVARVIAGRILRFHQCDSIRARLVFLDAKEAVLKKAVDTPPRPAWYCSGCPHNTSTKVPDGSLALAGIGCHVMASNIYGERTKTITHMGGEGATWIGQAPFSEMPHVFANLGDGTYYHSGLLAIRAAVAAGVNITYKILYNDAVAMTGGQPIDGPLSVPAIVRQVAAEGVARIALVSEDPSRWADRAQLPADDAALALSIHHRDELDTVQRQLREVPGATVLIYDQTCAAEKRRRRKTGQLDDPPARVVINEAVCEACGDCGIQSNCVSIEPLDTKLGRKRQINQSTCNKDYSCIKGFCPSFVTIEGGTLRKSRAGAGAQAKPSKAAALLAAGGARVAADEPDRAGQPAAPDPLDEAMAGLPEPARHAFDGAPGAVDASYNILITGIGGTGVITIGALLGMAAHLEGRGVSVLDMTGMSQKNGAVSSQVRMAATPAQIRSQRIATGEADLLLGCDLLTAGSPDAIAKTRAGRTFAAINLHEQPSGRFAHERDWQLPAASIRALVDESVGGQSAWIDATRLATALMGDSIATNLFMLGYAWQHGRVPLAEASILRAIELNGVSVQANVRAFRWGRVAAVEPARIERLLGADGSSAASVAGGHSGAAGSAAADGSVSADGPGAASTVQVVRRPSLDELVARRAALLTAYQDAAWARRYEAFVARVRQAEDALPGARAGGRGGPLATAVAQNLAKLMAYKDEYEVARLHADGTFDRKLAAMFEGEFTVRYHLAPPLLSRPGPDGRPAKRTFGPWMRGAFAVLARCRRLRGTALDPFGRTAERRMERALIDEYCAMIEALLPRLTPENLALAVEIASLPDSIRGFGPVKEQAVRQAGARREALLRQFG